MTNLRFHGDSARAYFNERDVSGDLHTITPDFSAETPDSTNFASAGWRQFDPGLIASMVAIEGFYSNGVGSVIRQLRDVLGASGGLLSVYLGDADGVGDPGFLSSPSVLEKLAAPINVGDLTKLSGSLKGSGKAGMEAVLLHPLAAETAQADGSSVDNLAASNGGGRGTIHATAATDSWTVKVQHSVDNSVWVDLITFTAITAAGAESIETATQVEEFVRITHDLDSSGSITYVAGFARYGTPVTPTVALTGSITSGHAEADIVTGGKTIILTLTDSTWVASGTAFDAVRQAIIDGLTSAGAEANGWNNDVRDVMAVTTVVRTSAVAVTITLPATAAYSITADETITVTVPAAAIQAGVAVVASPTFTITNA